MELLMANSYGPSYLTAVVPNRGGIPPQGGISRVQGRNFHFIVKLPIHCAVSVVLLFKLTLALSIIYITLYF